MALIFRLWSLVLRFGLKTGTQKGVLHKMLRPFYNELSIDDRQRILKYGLYVPLFIGESFARLRNKALTYRERIAITCLGCMTALFDDLFDEQHYSDDFIRDLLLNATEKPNHTAQIRLLLHLHSVFLAIAPDKTKSQQLMLAVFDAQVAARQQLNGTLSVQELEDITYRKGGFTMQLYRSAFDGTVSETEDALFYNLGAIGQLENDIFDIYKDYKQGINTLATTCTDIAELRAEYGQLRNRIFTLINQTSYGKSHKKAFRQLCALIIARAEVALQQLYELQLRTENRFCIEKYERNELICDMEKTKNRVNLIRHAAKCLKK